MNRRPVKNIAARSSSLSPLPPPVTKTNSFKLPKDSHLSSNPSESSNEQDKLVSKLKQEIILKNKIIYDLNKSQLWLKSKLPQTQESENDEKTRLFGLLERFKTDLDQAKEACEQNSINTFQLEKQWKLEKDENSYLRNVLSCIDYSTIPTQKKEEIHSLERDRILELESKLRALDEENSKLQKENTQWNRISKQYLQDKLKAEAINQVLEEIQIQEEPPSSSNQVALEIQLKQKTDKLDQVESMLSSTQTKMLEFESTLEEAYTMVDSMEKENSHLKLQLDSKEEAVLELREQVALLLDRPNSPEEIEKSEKEFELTRQLKELNDKLTQSQVEFETEMTNTLQKSLDLELEIQSLRESKQQMEQGYAKDLQELQFQLESRQKEMQLHSLNTTPTTQKEEQEEINKYLNQITLLTSQLNQQKLTIDSYKESKKSNTYEKMLEAERVNLEKELMESLEKLQELSNEKEELVNKNSELSNVIESLSLEIQEYNSTIQGLESNVKNQESKFEQLQTDYSSLESHLQTHAKESESLGLELESRQSEINSLIKDKQGLLLESESLKDTHNLTLNELNEIKSRNLHLEGECARAFEVSESQQRLVEALDQYKLQERMQQQALDNSNQEMQELLQKNTQLQETIKGLEDMIVSMDGQIVDLVDQIESCKKKFEYYEGEITRNENCIQELSDSLEQMAKEKEILSSKSQDQVQLLSQIQELQETLSTNSSDLTKQKTITQEAQENAQNLEKELENQLTRMASVTVEYDNLSKLFAVLKAELDTKDEQVHAMKIEFHELNSELSRIQILNSKENPNSIDENSHSNNENSNERSNENERDSERKTKLLEMESDLKQAEALLKRFHQETDILNGKLELEINSKNELEKESIATITRLQYETAQQEQELLNTQKELKQVKDLLSIESSQRQDLSDMFKKNSSLLDSNSIELSKRIQEIHDLKVDLENKDMELIKFKNEFTLLEEQLKTLTLVSASDQSSHSPVKQQTQEQELSMSKSESLEAKSLIQDLKSEISVAYEKISQLMMEKASREQEMEDLELENQELNSKLKELKIQMVELKDNLKSLFPNNSSQMN